MTETIKPVESVAYSANTFDDILVAMLGALGYNPATMGPLRYNPWGRDTLAVTGTSSPVSVATGDAIVSGKHYTNTAAKNITVPTPTTSTRIDRIVLRLDYTASPMTCTAERLAGTEGGSAPALTQTDGTTWEVSLAQVSITTGGVITVTDERVMVGDEGITVYALAAAALAASATGRAKMQNGFFDATTVTSKFATDSFTNAALLKLIRDGAFADSDATRALFADGIWTAAKIKNRTRTLFVPCVGGYQAGGTALQTGPLGHTLLDAVKSYANGNFYVPADYVSDMTIKTVIVSAAAGNIYCAQYANQGAVGEAYDTHTSSFALAAVSVGSLVYAEIASISVSTVAAGDYVALTFYREADNPLDTTGQDIYLAGWLVSYTADM